MTALIAAFFSAVFAATSTLIIKCFAKQTDSTVVTTVQSIVMLVFSALVCFGTGSFSTVSATDLKSVLFMTISGIATGLTWLFYYHALKEGDADKVMPIEKANIFLTILIAVFFFHETRFFAVKMAGSAVVLFGLLLLAVGSFRAARQGDGAAESEVYRAQGRNKGNIANSEERAGTNSAVPCGAGSCRWLRYALLSSLFAAVNTIFSKLALAGMNSNFGTLLNTAVALVVVLIFLAGENKLSMLRTAPRKELMAVILSGVSTAFNWIFYYYAVKYAPMTLAVPLNKLSVPMVILFSHYVLGSEIKKEQGIGLASIVAGMMMVAVVA